MTQNNAERAIETVSIGYTKIINGHVVIRTGSDSYQVGGINAPIMDGYSASLVVSK